MVSWLKPKLLLLGGHAGRSIENGKEGHRLTEQVIEKDH
jgi:hypothetical protein